MVRDPLRGAQGGLIGRAALALLLAGLLSLVGQPAARPAEPQPWAPIGPTADAPAGAIGADEHVPGELLVALASGQGDADAEALARDYGLAVLDSIPPLHVYRFAVPPGEEAEIAAALARDPRVRRAEPNGIQRLALAPDDPHYQPFQWNLRKLGLEAAWEATVGSPDVVVAVLDTGVDLGHPDLAPNLLPGYDFLNDDPEPQDDSSHGTHVAGVIAALGNNGQGVAGIAWRTKVLPVKVLNAQGRGPDDAMAKGLVFAADNGARIINVSSTGTRRSATLEEAIAYARSRDALVVAAAGNTGDHGNEVVYPAALAGVIAVAATDRDDRPAPFSQRHDYVELAAPGVGIASTAWTGAGVGPYALASGTSAAAPHVSGVAALLLALKPQLSADELRQILDSTADHLGSPGRNPETGFGRVNAARAVAAVKPIPASRPTETARPGPTPLPLPTLAPLGQTAPLLATPSTWYFAEGSTRPPFDTWLVLLNPGRADVTARLTYLTGTGETLLDEVTVPGHGRQSISVNQRVPDAEVSVKIESDAPLFAERAMYFGHDGHVSGGAAAPATTWYLAEGSTAAPFDTWILLQNPGPAPARVQLQFQKEDGSQQEYGQVVPPGSRRSVYVNHLFRAAGFSTEVRSDQPIVVERAMYFDGGAAGHGSVAANAPARTWYFAEGDTRPGADTWLLVQNPGSEPANLRLTFFLEDGEPVEAYYAVGPRSRRTIYANLALPDARFGVRLEADRPVVAERSVYFGGGTAGANVVGARVAASEWYLAEGTTEPPFEEEIAIVNPNSAPATVEVALYPADGSPAGAYRYEIGAASRLTVDVNELLPGTAVSARVMADRPIVVERTLRFADGQGVTTATGLPR